jgi:hypothetical protein
MILGCGKMRAHYRTPKPGFVENGGFSGIFYLALEPVPDYIMVAVSKKTPSKREVREDRPLRSGELARLSGVSADTLRHYERKGLLKSRRASNGYREYQRRAVERMRLIRNALAIGPDGGVIQVEANEARP